MSHGMCHLFTKYFVAMEQNSIKHFFFRQIVIILREYNKIERVPMSAYASLHWRERVTKCNLSQNEVSR